MTILMNILLLIMAALFVLLAFLGGSLGAHLGSAGGPTSFLLGGIVGSAISAGIAYFLAFLITDTLSTSETAQRITSLGFALLCFAAGLYDPITGVANTFRTAAYLRDAAPVMKLEGLEHFQAIDCDGNSVLTEQELNSALQNSNLNEKSKTAVKDLKSYLSEVGHVINKRSYPVTTLIWSGKVCVPMTTIHTDYTYGISTGDLESYPARVKETYKSWQH